LKDNDDYIEIRSVQQYLYCPHRWGLIVNECSWSENVFVYKGNLAHKRVDDGKTTFSSKGVICRSVNVYNDNWGLLGVLDCLELIKDKSGVFIDKYKDKYISQIIEYKTTAPKSGSYRYEDAMQLLAQRICIDNMLGIDSKTLFYYNDTKKRVDVSFNSFDYTFLKETLVKMRSYRQSGEIPEIQENQHCGGCSMIDICMPKGNCP